MKSLSDLSLGHWIYVVLIPAVLLFWRYLKSQLRFARNLRRTVYFLKTSDKKNLQAEKDKVVGLKIFKVDPEIRDISSDPKKILQNLDDSAAYVVGYDTTYQHYKKLLQRVNDKGIPLIIYALPSEITDKEHWQCFNESIYCDIANTTNRIAVILMSMFKIT